MRSASDDEKPDGGESSERAVAVDLGGTNVRAAVIDRKLSISSQARRALDRTSPEALLEGMAACVSASLAGGEEPASDPQTTGVAGIGVAMKGFVDYMTGVTVSSGFLGMKNVPVGPYLSRRFGLPVFVSNDVQAATIGELLYGAGRNFDDFIYLNVGTGIAAGLVFGGRLYRGAANLSGEFGHITVDRDGQPCPCGRSGCLEQVVSGPGIVAAAKRAAGEHPDSLLRREVEEDGFNATRVFELADRGDEAARRVMEETAAYLGDGLVNLVNLLNPGAIILGGGVFRGARTFARLLEEHVRTNAITEAAASLAAFAMSSLEVDRAGLIGAAGLVFEHGRIE